MTDLSLSRSQMLLLSGSANRPLATEVAAHLGQPLCQVTLRRFADGEIFVKIDENVRGRDVYIIQPTNPPAENMVELLLLMDAAKRASAARITAVIPYFGYARQDRKDQPRVAISAKLMANMVSVAGADRVLAMDFHQHQLQGFFDLPVDHLYAAPVFVNHFRQKALKRLGANDVYCCATHALLSGPAVDRLMASPVKEVVVTNTIAIPPERRFDRLRVLSIAGLLAKAIGYTHSDQSVSSLFD